MTNKKVTFDENTALFGFAISQKEGTLYRAESLDKDIVIYFETTAGEGRNYSRVMSAFVNGRRYRAQRYLIKYVHLVQKFSNELYRKYLEHNRPKYTSWGEYVDVGTRTHGVVKDVILCPSPDKEGVHLLEKRNGDVIEVETTDFLHIRQPGGHTHQCKQEGRPQNEQ